MDVTHSRTVRRRARRRAGAVGAVATVLLAGALSTGLTARAHAAASGTNPCGPVFTDAAGDDAWPPVAPQKGANPQVDIVSGQLGLSPDGGSLVTRLTVTRLSTTLVAGASANEYYMVFGAPGGGQYFTNVEVTASTPATGITYSWGTATGTAAGSTTFNGSGTATGSFDPATNTVSVTLPLSDIGSPAVGALLTQPYAETAGLLGAPSNPVVSGGALGTIDTAGPQFDYQIGQTCGSGTPAPTPTPTPTATPVPGPSGTGGFSSPVQIPNSAGLGEPSMAIDSAGRIFVTAPQSLGNVTGGGSPVWTSTDGGASFNGGVAPVGDPVSGGDTDLALDARDNLFQTDLWLGNSALALSTDHGASLVANEYGHVQPGDDRPWLAYSGKDNELFLAYDGLDAIHVAHSVPLADPHAGLLTPVDVPAVPESLIGGNNPSDQAQTRQCVCPPGGLAVDQASGQVYLSYSRQDTATGFGTGVARSDDGGLTWTDFSVPGSGTLGGGAFATEWNFSPIKVDSAGTVYVAWGEAQGWDAANRVAKDGVLIRMAASHDHGAHWTAPVTVSSTTAVNVFPTLDVSAPGVVDVAWYGAPGATGDPNTPTPARPTWNVYWSRVSVGAGGTPVPAAPAVAVPAIHTGCIQSGGGAACTDRSLLDFFQLVDDRTGQPDIIYTAGDAAAGTHLFFTHLAAAPAAQAPELPWVPLFLIAGGVTAYLAGRRRGASPAA